MPTITLKQPHGFWRSVRLGLVHIAEQDGRWQLPHLLFVLDIGAEKQSHKPLWRLPGGKRRPDETTEAALKREFLEETGMSIRRGRHLLLGDDLPHAERTRSLMAVNILVGGVRPEPTPGFATDEVAEVRWFAAGALPTGREPASLGHPIDHYNRQQVRDTLSYHWGELRGMPYAGVLRGLC